MNNYLYAMPYMWFAVMLGYEWYWILFVLVGTMVAKPIPHQAFMLRPQSPSEPRASWVTKIVYFFVKDREGRLDENLGWMIKAFCIAASFSIAASFNHHFGLSASVALFGISSSAIAYYLGWYKLNNVFGLEATEWGELNTGSIAGLGFLVGTIIHLW